jgi:hypothetical protein
MIDQEHGSAAARPAARTECPARLDRLVVNGTVDFRICRSTIT